jgi:hypothetical protein
MQKPLTHYEKEIYSGELMNITSNIALAIKGHISGWERGIN